MVSIRENIMIFADGACIPLAASEIHIAYQEAERSMRYAGYDGSSRLQEHVRREPCRPAHGHALRSRLTRCLQKTGVAMTCNLRIDTVQAFLRSHESRYPNHELVAKHAYLNLSSIGEGHCHRCHARLYKIRVPNGVAGVSRSCSTSKTTDCKERRAMVSESSALRRMFLKGEPSQDHPCSAMNPLGLLSYLEQALQQIVLYYRRRL